MPATTTPGLGANARIVFTASASGTYYLDAQSLSSTGTGTFALIVNSEPVAGSIALLSSRTGGVDFAGDTDLYSITLTAGQTYVFTLDGNTLSDPFLELLSASGAVLDSDDDSGVGLSASLQFTPATSGQYYLAARASGNGGTGTYVLAAAQVPTVSIEDAVATETDSGTSTLSFEVRLSTVSNVPVTVAISTQGSSTATVGADYLGKSGTLTFAPGQTTQTFTVQVLADQKFEPSEVLHVVLSNPVGAVLGVADGYGFIADDDAPYALPDDTLTTFQWYLYPGSGINVFPLWPEFTGAGVKVAVFDQGIDPTQPDLDGNLLVSLGRSAATLGAGGAPVFSGDNHGTAVAGTIAAERNGEGVVGVAYGASLVSIYSPLSLSGLGAAIANAYTYAKAFDVLNDSWGFANGFASGSTWAFYDNFNSPQFAAAGTALAALAGQGRNGLGTVVVQSAGNSYSVGDDTNLHNFQNSQYIITVAATDYFGRSTSYSSPGASILVSAPGGGGNDPLSDIFTTDRAGAAGYNTGNYSTITGTSFSAPIVSGVVALMLQANPRLGYRDVQEILASTALLTAASSNTWEYNGATRWNGGGMHYDSLSHDLGFGLVDARAAVRLAETWQGVHTVANREQVSATRSPGKLIPDNSTTGAFDSITLAGNVQVERVEVTLKVTHPYIGDLSVLLLSPGGTTSFLVWRPQQSSLSAYGSSQDNINFTFTTVLSMGESAAGTWTLSIFDSAAASVGTIDSWTLNVIGKPASNDDTYVFTDEYAESLVVSSARGTLTDTAGIDTLNASAVSTSSVLNLNAGATSTIDGAALRTAAGTVLENATGGDGNDTLTGNGSVNSLKGMRGSDTLQGGAGNDVLDGGKGVDTAVFAGLRKDYVLSSVVQNVSMAVTDTAAARVGVDSLVGIERLVFSDAKVAVDLGGHAGQVVKILGAVFGAGAVANKAFVGIGLSYSDGGMSYADLMQLAIDARLGGRGSSTDVVNLLYTNVVGSAPDAGTLAYYKGLLDTGTYTQGALGVLAAETSINTANINLVGLAQTGVEFV